MALFTASPKKAAALISTYMEIPRAYDINVELFFLASLRAYQEMHSNYFEEVEELAEQFVLEQKWTRLFLPTREELIETLHQLHSVDAREEDFSKYPELTDQRFIFLPGKSSQLLLNNQLVPSQHVYYLALQIGYSELKIRKRIRTSPHQQFDSFDQVMDNFRASFSRCLDD